jgi:hypothetical protein
MAHPAEQGTNLPLHKFQQGLLPFWTSLNLVKKNADILVKFKDKNKK